MTITEMRIDLGIVKNNIHEYINIIYLIFGLWHYFQLSTFHQKFSLL